jgi:hypothetical protein
LNKHAYGQSKKLQKNGVFMENDVTESNQNNTTEATQKEMQQAAEDLKLSAEMTGTAAVDVGRATYRHLQNKVVHSGQKVDRAIRGNAYMALGLSFCTGLVLGAYLSRPKAAPAPEK